MDVGFFKLTPWLENHLSNEMKKHWLVSIGISESISELLCKMSEQEIVELVAIPEYIPDALSEFPSSSVVQDSEEIARLLSENICDLEDLSRSMWQLQQERAPIPKLMAIKIFEKYFLEWKDIFYDDELLGQDEYWLVGIMLVGFLTGYRFTHMYLDETAVDDRISVLSKHYTSLLAKATSENIDPERDLNYLKKYTYKFGFEDIYASNFMLSLDNEIRDYLNELYYAMDPRHRKVGHDINQNGWL